MDYVNISIYSLPLSLNRDPIDGTTNFIHKQPFFCVSLAFAVSKTILFGVVYNPITEEFFHAIKGKVGLKEISFHKSQKGAFLNGKKISVSNVDSIHKSVIATNVGYDRTEEGIQFMTK